MRLPPIYGFPWRVCVLTSLAVTSFTVLLAPRYMVASSLIWTFLSCFLAEISVTLFYQVILYPNYLSPIRHLPHPSGGSYLNGHFSAIIKETPGLPMRRWNNEIPNNGLLYYRFLMNAERILVTGTKALGEVLVQKSYDFIKPTQFRAGLGELLGIGILLAEGEEHKIQRKNLMPAFHYRHVKELTPLFWSKSCEWVKALTMAVRPEGKEQAQELRSAPVIEIGGWANRATLDIIGLAGMGKDFNAIQDPDNELFRVYRNLFQATPQAQFLGMLRLFLPHWFLRALPVKTNTELVDGARIIRRTCRELIDQKKKLLDQEKHVGIDILSVALESGGFTEDNLVDQMMTFLAAGHETTATAMIWAVVLLCQHPDVQTQLRAEVRAHLPSVDDDASPPLQSHTLDRLPYLHAVCNEVLRVCAPVSMTLREAARDTTIQGQFVPKGTRIILVPWATNHDPKLWGPDASDFRPARWLSPGRANSGGAESNYALLTFLHGPRSCIGKDFAKAEFACLVAALVGRFEMEMEDPKQEFEIKGGITSKPSGGVAIRMRAVEGW